MISAAAVNMSSMCFRPVILEMWQRIFMLSNLHTWSIFSSTIRRHNHSCLNVLRNTTSGLWLVKPDSTSMHHNNNFTQNCVYIGSFFTQYLRKGPIQVAVYFAQIGSVKLQVPCSQIRKEFH